MHFLGGVPVPVRVGHVGERSDGSPGGGVTYVCRQAPCMTILLLNFAEQGSASVCTGAVAALP